MTFSVCIPPMRRPVRLAVVTAPWVCPAHGGKGLTKSSLEDKDPLQGQKTESNPT
ncbi:hypothetical protein DPMN_117839 [Dreissena polymorpha]|uniref:Uncharacterized protein n=1 Tax=Dreissena polymorpha TaxID=45954 RepID=A0A9D4GFT5_DREPO|nr:hypothetical protein DPMN_117839 [Dreissena polymorpha]